MTIDILLATFNGDKYVETQILSIISQSYQDWELIIHDDGSTDDTIKIINKWCVLDSRIRLINDGVKCGGAAQNFLYLLQFSNSNYVMFADQDDIWFDNKVAFMFDAIKDKDHSIPQVLYTNSYIWKEKTGIVGAATHTFPRSLKEFLFLNSGQQGCVAIFNKSMCKSVLYWHGECAMHDHLLHLIGLTLGEVTYFNLPLMLYRNHDANVTGGTVTKVNDIGRILKNHDLPVVDKKHYDSVKRFTMIYQREISSENFKIINKYLGMPQKGVVGRILDVFLFGFTLFDSRLKLAIKVAFRKYINNHLKNS